MEIWDDRFKNAGKGGVGAGVGKPNKAFQGGFNLELYLGFHLKLEHLYYFYPS